MENQVAPAPATLPAPFALGPENPILGPLDWRKPVRTKDGRRITVYAIDFNLKQPVVGSVDGDDEATSWQLDGTWMEGRPSRHWDAENYEPAPAEAQAQYKPGVGHG